MPRSAATPPQLQQACQHHQPAALDRCSAPSRHPPTCASRFLFSPSQKLTTPSPPAPSAAGSTRAGRLSKAQHAAVHAFVVNCARRLPACPAACRPAAQPTSYRLLHVRTPHTPPVPKVPKRVLKAMAFTGYTESLPPSLRRWHLKAYLRAWQGVAGGQCVVSPGLVGSALQCITKCVCLQSPSLR